MSNSTMNTLIMGDITTKLASVYTHDSQIIEVRDPSVLPPAPAVVVIRSRGNVISVIYRIKLGDELSGLSVLAYSCDDALYAIYPADSVVGTPLYEYNIDEYESELVAQVNGKVSAYQGVDKAGKYLKVGEDGYVTTGEGGSGGSVAFADITGEPSDNANLKADLDAKVSANPESLPMTFSRDSAGVYVSW